MHSPTSGGQVCFAQQLVCEIVAFAVVKHGYRAKALPRNFCSIHSLRRFYVTDICIYIYV